MRQVLKSCAPQEDLPLWLRSSGQLMAGSVPGTQSPQRRLLNPLEAQPTPDLGNQLNRHQILRSDSPPVPLAAPPYQRMASLPPLVNAHQNMPNAYGTLQVGFLNLVNNFW